MKRFLSTTAVAVALATGLGACSTTSPDVVQRRDAQRMSQIQDATVLSVRPVRVDGTQTGAGGFTGAVVGGVAGSSIGGGRGSVIASVLGAVAGAMAGNQIERSATTEDAVEVLVQLRNGERRSIVQAKAGETLLAGDAVVLVTTGGRTSVRRAPVPDVRS